MNSVHPAKNYRVVAHNQIHSAIQIVLQRNIPKPTATLVPQFQERDMRGHKMIKGKCFVCLRNQPKIFKNTKNACYEFQRPICQTHTAVTSYKCNVAECIQEIKE